MQALLLAAFMAAVPAQTPDTPVGHVMSNWLAAFNAADRTRLEAVFARFIDRQDIDDALQFRRQTGGFDLKKVLDSTPTRMRAWLQERDGYLFREARMELEERAPHRVKKWDLRVIPAPPEVAPRRLPEREALQEIAALIDEMANKHQFSGCALVARRGKVLLREVRGFQDREKEIPNRFDTKFNLGSMNKMFTAVAVLQLVQQGKLKLDDVVGKYLPNYPNSEVAKKVTLRQLLSHTGGMGDIFGPQYDANIDSLKETRDYIALYGRRSPEFEPGSRFGYSNYGFVVAGAVVEKVSGKSYFDYVRQRVFERAGMTSSDSYWKKDSIQNLAKGYTLKPGDRIETNFSWLSPRGSPAGGGYSTVEDLLRFANAFTTHQLLDERRSIQLITPNPRAPADRDNYGYGMGFNVVEEGGIRIFGASGGGPGISSDFRILPKSGYVIAVMSNLDRPAASRVARFAAARLPAN